MPNDDFVSKAVADAKSTLAKVNSGNVATRSGQPFAQQHEYSRAPYSLVGKVKEAASKMAAGPSEAMSEAKNVGEGIKARQEMAKGLNAQ